MSDWADEKAREWLDAGRNLTLQFHPNPEVQERVSASLAALLRSVRAEGYLAGQRRMQERAAQLVKVSNFVDDAEGTIEGKMRRHILALALEPEPMEETRASSKRPPCYHDGSDICDCWA